MRLYHCVDASFPENAIMSEIKVLLIGQITNPITHFDRISIRSVTG